MTSTYRIDRSYDWNYSHGPSFAGPYPQVPKTPMKDFFGIPVNSRIGIAAGLLLNAEWIKAYSRLGYDILTYKTVRSRERKCYGLPNWVFLDADTNVDPRRCNEPQVRRHGRRQGPKELTSSVSFGMPSKAPDQWMKDVARARKALKPGQALVVSVVASPEAGSDVSEMIADFADLAAMAREAGAQAVEANLSCPNVCTAEGDIYLDADLSGRIAHAMGRAASPAPVLLKVGYFPSGEKLSAFLRAVDGGAAGVTMTNGLSRPIVEPDGSPVFGPGREVAGVLGRGVHRFCVKAVRDAKTIIARDGLSLGVVGVGGISTSEDAARYFDAGADAVAMGSAPMFDPQIAQRFKQAHPEW